MATTFLPVRRRRGRKPLRRGLFEIGKGDDDEEEPMMSLKEDEEDSKESLERDESRKESSEKDDKASQESSEKDEDASRESSEKDEEMRKENSEKEEETEYIYDAVMNKTYLKRRFLGKVRNF
ncbi:hypothetical protein RUM44_002176 [Polyplax serrata]|uniref:Uncharacterized protein n=1 Tax=Polyplax serrata TaxID=468196 RepID=A0ABR1AM46_POLSC